LSGSAEDSRHQEMLKYERFPRRRWCSDGSWRASF
jgi:hypothetical protein